MVAPASPRAFFLERDPNWGVLPEVTVAAPFDLPFTVGTWRHREDIPQTAICRAGADSLGDYFDGGGVKFISGRFAHVLEGIAPEEVEIFNVSIKTESGSTVPGEFYVINILPIEDCLDLDAMDAIFWTPPGASSKRIKRSKGPLMRPEFCTDNKIWRPHYKEVFPIIANDLHESLIAAGVEGLRCQPFKSAR